MKRTRSKQARKGQFRTSLGNVLIVIGILCILSAGSLVLYNMWDSNRAAKASEEILQKLEEAQKKTDPEESTEDLYGEEPYETAVTENGFQVPTPKKRTDVEVDERVGDTGPDWLEESPMATTTVGSYSYIGTIEIPSLGIRLPVMNTWDYDRLKISACRYSGSYYTDDLVICAHNYASHFSPIKWVAMGADVYFTTVDYVVYHYIVTNRETVKPTAIDQMIGSVDEESWDLTLFTCNTGGQTRCAVRCVRG